jgi:uncharacterized protein (TIGR02145 family)
VSSSSLRINETLLAGLLAVSVSMAAISGKVTDTSGTAPISGALVQLEQGGQSVTTGPDGLFSLSGTAATVAGKGFLSQPQNPLAIIRNGLLWVNVAEKSAVVVSAFDLRGKALSTMRRTMEAGVNSMAAPYRGAGVYLIQVLSGNREIVLKGTSAGGVLAGGTIYSNRPSSSDALAKPAIVPAINDFIAVTKAGYLNYRVEVKRSDTSGIAIKMIDCADTVRDIDGNLYQAVRIGDQVWTVENLRTSKYTDSSPVTLDTSSTTWINSTTEKHCNYNNTENADTIRKYGALYNWYVVDPANPRKIAPTGWHVPADSEWTTLENYLAANGYSSDGKPAHYFITNALQARTDWHVSGTPVTINNNLANNNRSGFAALPCGERTGGDSSYIGSGVFFGQGCEAYWWSATEIDESRAGCRSLYAGFKILYSPAVRKDYGLSVRLVRD